MYCPNCGKKNDDYCKFCVECGTKLEVKENNKIYNSIPNGENPNDTGSGWWFVLGFFFQLIGLILFLIWNKTSPKNAKKVGLGALIGFIAYIIFVFAVFFLFTFLIINNSSKNKLNMDACFEYCGENYYQSNNVCYCDNGERYHINGEDSIKESINDIELYNWYSDITNGYDVVTVIALSNCPYCKDFKPIIESIAEENNFKLYIFDIDTLSENDQDVLKNTVKLIDYIGSSPYTFVTSNGEFVDSLFGYHDKNDTLEFLTSTGIIK